MYENCKIFILGMARSGYESAKLLSNYHNEIIVCDAKEQDSEHVKELEKLGVKVIITDKPEELLDNSFKVVVKNPGIKYTNPLVVKAKELMIPVVNEVEMSYHFMPDCQIIGVTGSNGKTTTTTLIYEFLKQAKKPVIMAGNMGIPVASALKDLTKDSILLLEISIQQLCNMQEFKTNVSVLTNLTPTHIDFMDTYENYMQTKKRIFNNHTKNDLAIINLENEDEVKLTEDIKSTKVYFSSVNDASICLKNETIVYNDEEIIKLKDIKLQGSHNYENIMCAIVASKRYGVSNADIYQVLSTFGGVEHRLEYVTDINGVNFYNDSKATNTVSTMIALKAFKSPLILILGGLDRGHSFDPLDDYLTHVKLIVCYGQTKDRIKEWGNKQGKEVVVVDNLIKATDYAYSKAINGDTILLSPACASWDQYKCFEDRGIEFKKEVNKIKESK